MIERVTLAIGGLGFGGGGALTVERALTRLRGVALAFVSPATETAYVEYDPSVILAADLMHAVEAAGFSAGAPLTRGNRPQQHLLGDAKQTRRRASLRRDGAQG